MKRALLALLLAFPAAARAGIGNGKSGPVTSQSVVTCAGASWNLDAGTIYADCANNLVGIGNTGPAYPLHVTGAEYVSGQKITGGSMTVQGNAFSVGASTLAVAGGKVSINNTSPRALLDVSSGATNTNGDAPDVALFVTPNLSFTASSRANLIIQTNDALAADKGGSIGFGGRDNTGTSASNFAGIKGAKTDATAGNVGGYLAFYTRLNPSGPAAENMRLDDVGRLGIGTTGPAAKFHMSSGTLTVDGNATYSASFIPSISSGSVSSALSGTFTNTVLGACTSGSSITVSLPISGDVAISFAGAMRDDTLNAKIIVGALADGAFPTGLTNAKGYTSVQEPVVSDNANLSFTRRITGLASGQHTFCLVTAVSAGTGTIDSTDSDARLEVWRLP